MFEWQFNSIQNSRLEFIFIQIFGSIALLSLDSFFSLWYFLCAQCSEISQQSDFCGSIFICFILALRVLSIWKVMSFSSEKLLKSFHWWFSFFHFPCNSSYLNSLLPGLVFCFCLVLSFLFHPTFSSNSPD